MVSKSDSPVGSSVHQVNKTHSTCQVNHDPEQIKGPEELLVGKAYLEFRKDTLVGKLLVTGIEPQKKRFSARKSRPDGSHDLEVCSMTEYGILPYESGLWNATNWLKNASSDAHETGMEKLLCKGGITLYPVPTGFTLYPAIFRLHRIRVPKSDA
jgi:hypothetical protein